MSLILEALKKSERQRRLGEAPSIGSPIVVVRRRRSLMPLLIGLIVVALGVGWWLRREPAAPEATPVVETPPATATPPANAPPAPAADTAARMPSLPPNAQPSSTVPAERAQSQAAHRPPRSKVAPDPNAALPADVRAKVDSGELVVANPALLNPGQPATIKESEPMPAPMTPPPPPVAKPAPAEPVAATTAATPEPAYRAPGSAPPPAPPSPPAADARKPAASAPAAAAASAVQGPPLIWELPYAQRRDIPELKVSMHVFAAEPAQRFVIVHGERYAEGDDIDGIKVVEIRTDGIVFDRQGVRFLYPRGGR